MGRGISDETGAIIEEIKKGTNVVVAKVKGGGIYVSKKGRHWSIKLKKNFQIRPSRPNTSKVPKSLRFI